MSKVENIIINESNCIKIELIEYKGSEFIDIRKMFKNEVDDWCPTKKGIRFNTELVDDVLKAIKEITE